jgi:hypothetical protein
MKTARSILGIFLSLISIGLMILVIQQTCEFDMAYLEASGFALILASILFFVFILISVFKARKWQAIVLITLSLVVGFFLIINVSFDGNDYFQILPFIFAILVYLVYGIIIIKESKPRLEKE